MSTTYSQLESPAPGVRVLKPEAWQPTWESRPRKDVAVGLRTLSPGECIELRAMAAQAAWEKHPEPGKDDEVRKEAYYEALLGYCVSRGTCDPNDASKPLPLWQDVGDALVFEALPTTTMRFLFDAIELTAEETCPTAPEATDEHAGELAGLLARKALSVETEGRVRRLLARARELLLEAPDK